MKKPNKREIELGEAVIDFSDLIKKYNMTEVEALKVTFAGY